MLLRVLLLSLASAPLADGRLCAQSPTLRGPGQIRHPASNDSEFHSPRSASDVLAEVPPPVARLQSPDAASDDSARDDLASNDVAGDALQDPAKDSDAGDAGATLGRRLVRRGDDTSAEPGEKRGASDMLDGFATNQLKSLGSALAVVLGLMLVCVWIMKRAAPKGVQLAPSDVARVIGRVPLAAKQQAQLIYLGNKILLISVTPAGSETLGEIDDPSEVQRIVALCQQNDTTSAKAAFEDVFRSFDKERVSGFLDDNDSGGRSGGKR